MKKVFKSMSLIILVALVVSILPVKLQAAAAKKPTLSGKKISVNVGQSKTISVKSNGKKITSVKWRSGDNKIAKVSKKNTLSAKIKGISEGKTVITATVKVKGKSYKLAANVTVKNDKKKTEESENGKSELDNEASANAQDEQVSNETLTNTQGEQASNETENTVIPAESSPFSDEEIRQAARELMVKQYALSTGSYEEFAKIFYDTDEETIKNCQDWISKEASRFSGKMENIFAQVLQKKDNVASVFCVDHSISDFEDNNLAYSGCITDMLLINVGGIWLQTCNDQGQLTSTGLFNEPDKITLFAPKGFLEAKNAGRYADSSSGDTYYALDNYNVLNDCIIKNIFPFSWVDENGDFQAIYFFSNGTTKDVTVTINSLEVMGMVPRFDTAYSFIAPAMQNTTYQICIPANKITGSFEKNKWGRYKSVFVGASSTIE